MSHESQQGRTQAHHSDPDHARPDFDLAPGRVNLTSRMDAPAHPTRSGLVMRKGDNGVAPGAEQALDRASGSAGIALPDSLRDRFESSLGVDLSGVRVHTGGESAQAANAVGAKAYTLGNDIHFNAGEYDPSSQQGQQLLAHEVAHTVQQNGGSKQPQFKLEVSSAGDHLEVEADRAAEAMVQGTPTSVTMGSGVQRKVMRKELSDAQKKTWEQQNGDQICSKIKTALDQWKAFRGNPASYQSLKDIKSHGACSQLSELVRLGGADFGQFAKEKLGADAPPYLSEMAAFIGDFALLINVVPGVAHQDPKHEYTMKKDETSSWNNVPFVPFTSLTVEYRNAFGWYWKRDFTGTQLQWKVGVEFKPTEAPGKKIGGGGVAGDPAKNKVNPMIPLPATISINVDCKAKPSGYGYWGFDNLAGALTTADGPSLKGTYLGFGAKTATGGIISIIGSGGPVGTLDFLNIQTKFALKPDGPDNPLESGKPDETGKWKKKGATISATLVAAGAGGMKATGPAQVSVPELRPKPVLEEQQWKYFIYGFETGSADAPIPIPEINPIALMAKSDVDKKKAELDSIQEYLKEAGIKESFKVSVMCEGYASRRWEAAGNNETMRKQKNQELSEKRAQNVLEDFRGVLGVEHEYSAVGKGPAVAQVTMQDAQTKTSMVTEEGKDIVDQKLREIAKTYESAGATPDEAKRKAELERKNVEQSIGRDSNQREARRVNVLVVWRGHKIEWAPGHQPNPSVPASGGGK